MEIIFADPYYDSGNWVEGKYATELTKSLSEFDTNIQATNDNIGHGADWPVVSVEIFKNLDWASFLTIVGIGTGGLFLLGDKINKNIDVWIDISKKFKKLIGIFHPARIDENGAAIIVMNDLLETHYDPLKITLFVQIVEFTPVPWGKSKLCRRPDALYLITARVPDAAFIYGIKSNTNIEFKHELRTAWHEFN